MTSPRARPRPTHHPSTDPRRWLAPALVVVGVGLAVNSVVGPLVLDLVDYPLSETLVNQTIGLDAVILAVVAPLSALAAWWVRRHHPAGPVAGVVVGSFAAYMLVQYLVGPDYLHYPGTLALQLGLFTLSWVVALGAWHATAALPPPSRPPERHWWAMFALAGFVVLRYLPIVPAARAGEPLPDEALADPAMYWTIVVMDLGVFVPVAVATAVALRRGRPWAHRAWYTLTGWFVLTTVSVLGMSIAMIANDDPYAAPAQVALFAVTAVAVTAYAARVYQTLPSTATPPDDPPTPSTATPVQELRR